MSYVANADGALLVLQLGNGATPEVFTSICSINAQRSIDFTATASTTELADCVTPTNPAQVVRIIKSTDTKFTGAGVTDAPSFLQLIQWNKSGLAKNCKVIQNLAGAQGGWTVTGAFVCTSVQDTGTRGDSQTCNITIEQASTTAVAANA